jgi:hypothetical protein
VSGRTRRTPAPEFAFVVFVVSGLPVLFQEAFHV